MIKQPPYLKKNDKIAIVCPAKKLPGPIDDAIAVFKEWGLDVITGTTVDGSFHQFSGTDKLRTQDLQQFLDDPSIKAIIAGRGGYGTIRIIDALNFEEFSRHPKWLVGFSDITVLLSHALAKLNTQSIHGQMPMTFDDATPQSIQSLKDALFGNNLSYTVNGDAANITGIAEGVLIGGNLTLLTMLEGSASAMDYTDKILFIEDVGEHEYAIDRMLRMLKRAGKLKKLKGLIVGAFNEIKAEEIFFGQTPCEVINDIVKEYKFPVCYDFPVGHIDNNMAMVIGRNISLNVEKDNVTLNFL